MRSVKGMVVLLAFISGLAACSDDDDGGGSSSPLPSTNSTATGGGMGGDGGGNGDATTGGGSGTTGGTGSGDSGGGGGTGGGNTGGGTVGGGSGSPPSETARRWRDAAMIDYSSLERQAWIRMDDGGHVLVAHQSDDGPGDLYISEYSAGSNSWGPTRRLGYAAGSYNIDLERAPGGRAIATWIEMGQLTLQVALYQPGVGWSGPQALAANQPFSPQAVIRDDGSAEVVYSRVNAGGQRDVVIRRRAANASTFGAEQVVLDADVAALVDFALAGEQRTLLWFQKASTGVAPGLRALRFVNGTWQESAVLTASGGAGARVVMDGTGAARAYWQVSSTQNGTRSFELQHRYVAGGSNDWRALETIPFFQVPPTITELAASAVNIHGEAVGIKVADADAYTALYRPGQGWGPLQQVVTQYDGVIRGPAAALTATGFATATWIAGPWLDEGLNYSEIKLWGSVYR